MILTVPSFWGDLSSSRYNDSRISGLLFAYLQWSKGYHFAAWKWQKKKLLSMLWPYTSCMLAYIIIHTHTQPNTDTDTLVCQVHKTRNMPWYCQTNTQTHISVYICMQTFQFNLPLPPTFLVIFILQLHFLSNIYLTVTPHALSWPSYKSASTNKHAYIHVYQHPPTTPSLWLRDL